MRNLGMMLRKGQGTPQDPKKAEEILLRASEAGLPTAQADLADMYLKGELGPPDLKRALPLLEAAAAGNHPVAQYQLGQFYETGAPPLVPQNLEIARQLYASGPPSAWGARRRRSTQGVRGTPAASNPALPGAITLRDCSLALPATPDAAPKSSGPGPDPAR